MTARLLALDNAIDRASYRPVEEWSRAARHATLDAAHVPSGERIPPLDRYTHLLITGSEACFSQSEPWFEREAEIVRDAVDRGLAVLGSCFGHQMLAWALSGPHTVRRAPIPELGWIAIDIAEPDPLLHDLPNPWHAFSAHLDEVVGLPAPWRILASTAACSVQAMRYGDRPIWGIQPHPETTPDEAQRQMAAAIKRYPVYARKIRRAIDSPVRDDRTAASLVAAFLRQQPNTGP